MRKLMKNMRKLIKKEKHRTVSSFHCYDYDAEWYLAEMELAVPPKEIPFGEMVVPENGIAKSSWQTAYAEQFLNPDGTERICDLYETPKQDDPASRVAFFICKTEMHILKTPYGEFPLSDADPIPERLRAIIELPDAD